MDINNNVVKHLSEGHFGHIDVSLLEAYITVDISPISVKTGHNQVSFIQRYLLLGNITLCRKSVLYYREFFCFNRKVLSWRFHCRAIYLIGSFQVSMFLEELCLLQSILELLVFHHWISYSCSRHLDDHKYIQDKVTQCLRP